MANELGRITANRQRNRATDAELPELVLAAFEGGHTWQDIAQALGGRTKQRVYQLRAEGIANRDGRR